MRAAILAVVALAVALPVLFASSSSAQTTSTSFNLNTSIQRASPIVQTACGTTAVAVACPTDTKTQLHWLRGAATSSVFLGIDPTVTATTGLEIAPGGRQAWDVAGGLVRCVTASGTVTLYSICGRGL